MNIKRLILSLSAASFVACAFLFWFNGTDRDHRPARAPIPMPEGLSANARETDPMASFEEWLEEFLVQPEPNRKITSELPIDLAYARREAMKSLMQTAPDRALEQALSYAQYARLPKEIQALVERPFSEPASLEYLMACGPNHSEISYLLKNQRGATFETFLPEHKRVGLSKTGLPLQGIQLDEFAVVRGSVFQVLEGEDAELVQSEWPAAYATSTPTSYATGEPVKGPGVVAVSGGRVFHFQNKEELSRVEAALRKADGLPGMTVGSQWILRELAGDGGFPLEQFALEMETAAYASTTGPKTAFFILVDFPDRQGLPVSNSQLEQVIDTQVSSALDAYSFGLSSMDATVPATVVRVSSNSTDYLGSPKNRDDLYKEALQAYIDLGNPDPRSSYDTIGVFFADIGFSWAGLASVGGQRMWLNGSTNIEVILHEFGHNYGLHHANYWVFDAGDASSTDPVDPSGANEEYGDDFDVMGNGNLTEGHFHMAAKEFLGWIAPEEWADLSDSSGNGSYRIYRFDDRDSSGGLHGLRVAKSASSDHYWIGYRRDYADLESFAKGAYLIWERADGTPDHNQSWLVDTTPGSINGKEDAVIALGKTYSDTSSDVHITTVARGGSAPSEYIDVVIHLGPFPGNVAPSGTLAGPTTVEARQLVLFSAETSDGDGDTLAYSWDMGDGRIKPNSPTVTHSWTVAGNYALVLTVSDMKGGTVTLNQNVTVTDPLDNWTARTSGTVVNLYAIASNETHVIVGGEGGTLLRSTDGVTWTDVSPDGFKVNIRFYDIAWTGSEFVAVGQDYDFGVSGWEGVIYTSPGGEIWTRAHETNTAGTQLKGVASDGASTLVAVGGNATVLRKTGAGAWGAVATSVPATHVLQDIAYGNGFFIFVGHATEPSYSGGAAIFRSSDGSSWTDLSSGFHLDSWKDFRVVEYLDGAFHAGGFYGQASRSTNNGASWSTTLTGEDYTLSGIAEIDGVFYAVGKNESNRDVEIDLVSANGTSWTVTDPSLTVPRNRIAAFNGTFLSVSEEGGIRQSGTVSGSVGFGAFVDTYFPGGGADALAGANADGDWSSNLIEYSLGGLPDDPTSSPARPSLSFDGSDRAVFEISRTAKQKDIAYSVWKSEDLTTWTQVGLTIVEDSATSLRVRSDESFASETRLFFRLRLDQGSE